MASKMYMFDSDDPDIIGPVAPRNGERNGTSFFTPAKTQPLKQDRVFKTPMTFSPRIAGEHVKPSPSRMELWKEELGLDDTAANGFSDSDQSGEEDGKENRDNNICSAIEFQALQRELDERNRQRDDLLFRIKSLGDKNKQYQQKIEKDENSKKQQIKIIKKTHDTHLQEKENLIKNLEDIIEELESKLEKGDDGDIDMDRNGALSKLIEDASNLQSEKAIISSQLADAQLLVATQKEELTSVKINFTGQEEKVKKLEEEVSNAKQSKGSNTGELEQIVWKQEEEIDKLQRELNTLKSKPTVMNGHVESEDLSKRLKEENERMKKRLESLDAQMKTKHQNAEKLEYKLKEEVRMLTSDNQALSQEVRTTSAKITALQARSPEIVTKIQKVEVENTGAQEELERTRKQLSDSTTKISTMCTELNDCKKQCDEVMGQLRLTEEQNESLKSTSSQNKELLKKIHQDSLQISELEQNLATQSMKLNDEIQHLTSLCAEKDNKITENNKDLQWMENQIKTCEEDLIAHKKESEENSKQLRATMQGMKENLAKTYPALQSLATDYIQLKKYCDKMPAQMKVILDQGTKELCQALAEMSDYNQELIKKYRKEMQLRKKYHNELVDLKGNIRVFCRLRPKIKEDGGGVNAQLVCECDKDDDGLVKVMYKARPQSFEVDRVFSAQSTQIEVFNEVQPLVISCIDGFNVCIFAYGQTGSGKTHTMEGPKSNPGINQRALQELFRETSERSNEWDYVISVSFIEIYNESIRDLLSSNHTNKLEVKLNPGGGVHVPGLSQYDVNSPEDVNQVFRVGQENRATAATNMNEHSSRSHALLCVEVVGTNSTTGARTIGKLNLVDLAGSERVSKSGADGARLKEAQNINKSLSCLGDVIHALRSRQPHVPYRNSRLTYLLQDSLGGDSKTLMIVQVSPVEKNVGESVASMNFAQRVRSVELGQATKKVENAELAELKEKLAHYEDGSPGSSSGKSKFNRRK